METNAEIRKRMDTYRRILLLINWIGSIAGILAGFALIDRIEGVVALIIIGAIILGIIGHFLTNVALAIPFILLNNGDILESMKENKNSQKISNLVQNNASSSKEWICKKCNNTNRSTALFCNSCGEKK